MPSAARVLLGIVTAIACLAPLAGTIHVADDALAHAAAGPGGTDDRDPAALLSRFLDARNRGDLDAALALVADDVTYIGGHACSIGRRLGSDSIGGCRTGISISVSSRASWPAGVA
jgi:hypothetical protein